MQLGSEQRKRLEEYQLVVLGLNLPEDEVRATGEAAEQFELYCLLHDLPFLEASFRNYLLALGKGTLPPEERVHRRDRLQRYYHAFYKKLHEPPSESGGTKAAGGAAPEELPLPPLQINKRPLRNLTCPKCGTIQPESDTCIRCGVVFAKLPAPKLLGNLIPAEGSEMLRLDLDSAEAFRKFLHLIF